MEKNQKLTKECWFCKKNAICLCFKCNNYFCEKCFKVTHDLINESSHKKEEIDTFVPIDLKCQVHDQFPMYLFCIDEKGNSIYYI